MMMPSRSMAMTDESSCTSVGWLKHGRFADVAVRVCRALRCERCPIWLRARSKSGYVERAQGNRSIADRKAHRAVGHLVQIRMRGEEALLFGGIRALPEANPGMSSEPKAIDPSRIARRTEPWVISYRSGCAERKRCCSAASAPWPKQIRVCRASPRQSIHRGSQGAPSRGSSRTDPDARRGSVAVRRHPRPGRSKSGYVERAQGNRSIADRKAHRAVGHLVQIRMRGEEALLFGGIRALA